MKSRLVTFIIAALFLGCGKLGLEKNKNRDCVLGSSCNNKEDLALRNLIESIPKMNEEAPVFKDTVLPESISDYFGNTHGEPSYEHKELHDSVSTFEQLVAFDPNSDVLWPGSVIQGRTLHSGLLSPVPLKHSPSNVTITNLMMPRGSEYSARVEKPSHSTVTQAIQNLLTQDLEMTSAAKASFMIKEFRSLEQGLNQVGISAKWIGGEARASLNSSSYSEKNNFIVKFTQNYYTASYEPPATPESIFAPGTKLAEAELYIYEANPALHKENNPPMYISSVSYGRTLIFIFSSDVESSLMKASLEAAFNGTLVEGNLNVKAEEQKLFQNFETKVLVLGGSGESMVHLLTGDKTKGINEWIAKGANFSQKSPGVPISYMARYLRDYDIAKLSLNTQYEVRTSQPIPIKNFQIAFHTLDDNKDAEEAVDVWITQEGQILYQGSFGQGENWNDHTEKGFTLPMTANFKGGLNSCNGMKLRIRKRPSGSEKGCGWNMALDFVAHLEHGRGYSALSVEDSKGKRWGDDSDYDRTFTLKCK